MCARASARPGRLTAGRRAPRGMRPRRRSSRGPRSRGWWRGASAVNRRARQPRGRCRRPRLRRSAGRLRGGPSSMRRPMRRATGSGCRRRRSGGGALPLVVGDRENDGVSYCAVLDEGVLPEESVLLSSEAGDRSCAQREADACQSQRDRGPRLTCRQSGSARYRPDPAGGTPSPTAGAPAPASRGAHRGRRRPGRRRALTERPREQAVPRAR